MHMQMHVQMQMHTHAQMQMQMQMHMHMQMHMQMHLGCLPNAPSDSQPIKRARHASNQLAAPSHFVYTRDGASSNVAASSRIEIAIWSSYRSTLPLTRRVLMSSAELAGEAAATVPASKVIGGGSGRRKTWSGRKRSTYE